MSEIKRYDYGFIKGVATGMEQKPDGDYVKIEDYEKLLEANALLQARRKVLESTLIKAQESIGRLTSDESCIQADFDIEDYVHSVLSTPTTTEHLDAMVEKRAGEMLRQQALDELAAESQRLGMYDAKKEG